MFGSLVVSFHQLQAMTLAFAHNVLTNSSSVRFVSLVDFDQLFSPSLKSLLIVVAPLSFFVNKW